MSGRVKHTPGPLRFLLERPSARELEFVVDARSRLEALERAGQPRVRAGDRIQVAGHRCGGELVVRRLSVTAGAPAGR